MDTLYTFGDTITHHKTESVHFWGLMNSATKNIGAKIIANTILGVPYYNYSILGPKTLF